MEAAAWQLTSIRPRDEEPESGAADGDSARRRRGQTKGLKGPDNSSLATRHTSLVSRGEPIEVHVLTGRKFWSQTAFCLYSFALASGRELRAVIHDDGSLDRQHADFLLRLFPGSRVEARDMIETRLEKFLPATKFPRLRERWLHYPNIRKLTDPHAGGHGWKLVIDSDLLFLRPPNMVCEWADNPDRPLHAVDSETSYGYPLDVMSRLAGHQVVERLNVGLCGLQSQLIDWERLEYWCEQLISAHGTHYYLEQALVAMLVAGKDCAVMSPEDYVTLPLEPEASRCKAVMHHYVASSKSWYFRTNWRRVMAMNS